MLCQRLYNLEWSFCGRTSSGDTAAYNMRVSKRTLRAGCGQSNKRASLKVRKRNTCHTSIIGTRKVQECTAGQTQGHAHIKQTRIAHQASRHNALTTTRTSTRARRSPHRSRCSHHFPASKARAQHPKPTPRAAARIATRQPAWAGRGHLVLFRQGAVRGLRKKKKLWQFWTERGCMRAPRSTSIEACDSHGSTVRYRIQDTYLLFWRGSVQVQTPIIIRDNTFSSAV